MDNFWPHFLVILMLGLVFPIVRAFSSGNQAEKDLRRRETLDVEQIKAAEEAIEERELLKRGIPRVLYFIGFLLFWAIVLLLFLPSAMRTSPHIAGGGFGG